MDTNASDKLRILLFNLTCSDVITAFHVARRDGILLHFGLVHGRAWLSINLHHRLHLLLVLLVNDVFPRLLVTRPER